MSKEAIKYYEKHRVIGDYLDKESVVRMLDDFAKEHHTEQLILHGVSKRTLKRLCSHEDCNKEFTVKMAIYGDKSKSVAAMQQCPHCDKRNDLWLELS